MNSLSIAIFIFICIFLLVLWFLEYRMRNKDNRNWENRHNILRQELVKAKAKDIDIRIGVDQSLCEVGRFTLSGTSETRMVSRLADQLILETNSLLPGQYNLKVTVKKLDKDFNIKTLPAEDLFCTDPEGMFNVLRGYISFIFINAIAIHLDITILNITNSITIPVIYLRPDSLSEPLNIEVYPYRAKEGVITPSPAFELSRESNVDPRDSM